MSDIIVCGAGGHAVSVKEAIQASGHRIMAYVDRKSNESVLLGNVPRLETIPDDVSTEVGFVVAIGDNFVRHQVMVSLYSVFSPDRFPTIIHPSASVASSASVGAGSVVLQGAVVGGHTSVGVGVIINSGSVVDHECEIGDYSSVGPGSSLGGRVRLGCRSAVALGATVKHGVNIGDDTVVGGGSYVHRDLDRNVVAFGVPAILKSRRNPGDPYLQ